MSNTGYLDNENKHISQLEERIEALEKVKNKNDVLLDQLENAIKIVEDEQQKRKNLHETYLDIISEKIIKLKDNIQLFEKQIEDEHIKGRLNEFSNEIKDFKKQIEPNKTYNDDVDYEFYEIIIDIDGITPLNN